MIVGEKWNDIFEDVSQTKVIIKVDIICDFCPSAIYSHS